MLFLHFQAEGVVIAIRNAPLVHAMVAADLSVSPLATVVHRFWTVLRPPILAHVNTVIVEYILFNHHWLFLLSKRRFVIWEVLVVVLATLDRLVMSLWQFFLLLLVLLLFLLLVVLLLLLLVLLFLFLFFSHG